MASLERALNEARRYSAVARALGYDGYSAVSQYDPEKLIASLDLSEGGLVEIEGKVYFRDPSEGLAFLTSTQLRSIAQELDNRNGVELG